MKFYNEDMLERKLKVIWKKNVWLDALSCSIHYKNLLRKKTKKPEQKKYLVRYPILFNLL